jgi:hypothetical protein
MIEVEQEQDTGFPSFDSLGDDAHELAPVAKTGNGISVGIPVRSGFRGFVGIQSLTQVSCAAPSEKNDRDIQDEGDSQHTGGIGQGTTRGSDREQLAAQTNEQKHRRDGSAAGDDVTARQLHSLVFQSSHALPTFRMRPAIARKELKDGKD